LFKKIVIKVIWRNTIYFEAFTIEENSTLDPDSILVITTVLDLLLLIDIFNFVSSDLILFKPKWLSNLLVFWLCLKPLEDLAIVKILYSGFKLSR